MPEKYRVTRQWDGSYEISRRSGDGAEAIIATLTLLGMLTIIVMIILFPLGLLYLILSKPKIILNSVASVITFGLLGFIGGFIGGIIGVLTLVFFDFQFFGRFVLTMVEMTIGMGVLGFLLSLSPAISVESKGLGKMGRAIILPTTFAILGVFMSFGGLIELKNIPELVHATVVGLIGGIGIGIMGCFVGGVDVNRKKGVS